MPICCTHWVAYATKMHNKLKIPSHITILKSTKIVTKIVTWYTTEITLVISKKLLFKTEVYFSDVEVQGYLRGLFQEGGWGQWSQVKLGVFILLVQHCTSDLRCRYRFCVPPLGGFNFLPRSLGRLNTPGL